MSNYWNTTTKNIEAYVPGEQPRDKKYVKLNTNENPYPPSPKVIKAIKKAVNGDLRLYPDPVCDKLKQTIADCYGVDKSEVFVGNSSDEVLAFSFAAFFDHDKPVLFPDVTYSFYPVYCKLFNLKYKLVELNEDFSIPTENFLTENTGIIFPNPNAPTGRVMEESAICKILDYNLKNAEKIVIIDEAYIDFGGKSMIDKIKEYPNLLVVQTLSKSRSLAGLRVGFALGNKELIAGLERVKNSINSYTLDRLALTGSVEAFKDIAYFNKICAKIIKTRDKATKTAIEMGFNVIPSSANFIFISHKSIPAKDIYLKLKDKGVLVRYFNLPKINNYLRVSIGSDKEMAVLFKKLAEITGQK